MPRYPVNRTVQTAARNAEPLAQIVDAYYSVRTGHDYGVGYVFDLTDKEGAIACAKEQIKPIPHGVTPPSSWVKVSIETRWNVRYVDAEAMGDPHAAGFDRAVDSFEVTLTDEEKAEKLGQPVTAGLA